MKKKLYYVVEKQLQDLDGFEETTGLKKINMYDIDPSQGIVPFGDEIECSNEDSSVEMIQDYLIDNGHGDEEFELIQL